jgi:hypothetical protein
VNIRIRQFMLNMANQISSRRIDRH